MHAFLKLDVWSQTVQMCNACFRVAASALPHSAINYLPHPCSVCLVNPESSQMLNFSTLERRAKQDCRFLPNEFACPRTEFPRRNVVKPGILTILS